MRLLMRLICLIDGHHYLTFSLGNTAYVFCERCGDSYTVSGFAKQM